MTREEAIRYLYSSGMSDEQVNAVVKALEQEPCEDAISRQAVLGIIHFENNWLYDTQSHNANTVIAFSGLRSKVKALPSVNPQEQESVIDKIRAEIEQERIGYPPSADYYKAIMKCLQIIDKYKESEDKE